MPEDSESRYMLRVWREIEGDDNMVLLNDIDKEFDTHYNPDAPFMLNNEIEVPETYYTQMDSLFLRGENGDDSIISYMEQSHDGTLEFDISDTFIHHEIPEGSQITYHFTLYVYNKDEGKYYVKKVDVPVEVHFNKDHIITGIDELPMGTKMVRSMEYYNVAGAMSEKPFDGVNIVVARYTDGTTSTYKVIYPTK